MKNTLLEFAPYGAGSPPALVLALNLYKSILDATSADMWLIAMIVAVLGVVFTIAIEAGTYKALAQAFAYREWKAAGIAALGSSTVTALIIYGVYSGAGTRALATSSIAMVVGYILIMLKTYMGEKQTAHAGDLRGLQYQAEIAKAEMETARANARAAKFAASESQPAKVSLGFACSECEQKFKSQNALNAHKSAHKAKDGPR